MASNGFKKEASQFGGNQGFDGVYIKRNASGGVEEIIINEAKQLQATGNIRMNAGNTDTRLPPQMSDEWVENVLSRMFDQGGDLRTLSNLIRSNLSKVTKTVTAVDRSTGEIIILKLSKY